VFNLKFKVLAQDDKAVHAKWHFDIFLNTGFIVHYTFKIAIMQEDLNSCMMYYQHLSITFTLFPCVPDIMQCPLNV
jgi:hypothetical protein